ncbi:MAG: polysaccharide export protein [Desulfobulbaceae bacterium]|nr:polysaccharide export protein [Desulfobulbaceae bacterium]
MTKYFFPALLVMLLFTGCARQQLQPTISLEKFQEESARSVPPSSKKFIPQGNFSAMPSLGDEGGITDYILGSGDLITITVFESDELNTETRISSRGDLAMPLLGRVHIEGLTASEAEKKIEQALTENFMHTAHVSLFVKERMNQQITLVGAVKQPGTFETQSRKRILEVLAFAGGLSQTAADTAYVTRKNKDNGTNQVYLVDLDALLTEGRVDMNMLIQGGDVIFIPESDMIQVDGAVRRPGSFKIDGEMTVDSAIASAGGLANYADEDDIKLIRKTREGKREIVQVSLDDIIAMKQNQNKDINNDLWQELLLRDGDVIFVEASGARSFYSGVGFSIGFMGTGMTFKNPTN